MNAIVKKDEIATVRTALDKMKPQMAMALPKHITPDRMLRVAMTAIQNTPKLLECTRESLYSSIMKSAQLGLEPDGILGQAYLIPFSKNINIGGKWHKTLEVQFIIGYRGLIDLARRSGDVQNIIAKEVYESDEFTVDWSQEVPFTHKPDLSKDRGEVTHFWALARFKDGGFHWDYMTRSEVETIRDKGNGKTNKIWEDHFIEMGKKTVIRRIAKYLPMSVQKAALYEELTESGKKISINDSNDLIIEHETPESELNNLIKTQLSKEEKIITQNQEAATATTEGVEEKRALIMAFNIEDYNLDDPTETLDAAKALTVALKEQAPDKRQKDFEARYGAKIVNAAKYFGHHTTLMGFSRLGIKL